MRRKEDDSVAKTAMNPDGLPTPRGSYSLVNIAQPGRLVFIAGQTASDPEGNVVGIADARAQTRYILEKIKRAVEAAGRDDQRCGRHERVHHRRSLSPGHQRSEERSLGRRLSHQHHGAGRGLGAPRIAVGNKCDGSDRVVFNESKRASDRAMSRERDRRSLLQFDGSP